MTNEHQEQKPEALPTVPEPRPSTGRSAGQVWREEAKIVRVDDDDPQT